MLKSVQAALGFLGFLSRDSTMAATSKVPTLKRLWWAAIFLLGTSAGAVAWTIWQLRTDAIEAAVSDAGNIATILAGQLSRSLYSIDAVLHEVTKPNGILERDGESPSAETFSTKETHDRLKAYLSELPHIFQIVVANADGKLVVSTAAWPTPTINISDREYFAAARDRTNGQLIASTPIQNRINGAETIVFARRLEATGGAFAGVIFASVNTRYFEAIYGSTHSVRSLIFNLIRHDGTILFRHPDTGGLAGQKLSSDAVFQEAIAKGIRGFRIRARADGNIRYVSVRKVPEYPLFVNISVTETTALAGWFRRAGTIAVGSIALLFCSLYLLFAFTRQMRLLGDSETSLLEKSQQLDAALNNMSQGLSMFDHGQRLVLSNRQYAELYGLHPEQLAAGTARSHIIDARVAAGTDTTTHDMPGNDIERPWGPKSGNTIEELKDGRVISVTRRLMSDGGWVSMHQDITAQRRVEAELARMARFDSLTGLSNRAMFLDRAADAVARLGQTGESFSILMIDLDRFKVVNDSMGHAAGDSLLKAVADRLQRMVRQIDSVARLGGDEFAVVQVGRKDQREDAARLAAGILETITAPYEFDGRQVVVGTSIGITLAPADGDDLDDLIRNADLALYKAKSEGRNQFRFYESAMEVESRDRRELEEDMKRALARKEFELHYQTIIDLTKQECCGVESLVRWRHPERGLLLPNQFIPLAEESGLIVPLGAWILRQACIDAMCWPSHLSVAVNLSPRQFSQNDLAGDVKSALTEAGLAPTRLQLEITETILLEKSEENLSALGELKGHGVSIVLDDFGIGYSSMRYLQMLSFDRIKIDRSFIQSMPTHADSVAIVCAIAGLGRSLGIETTAEGVETAEQLAFVRNAGCQSAQGFLFSQPVPAPELSFERPDLPRGDVAARLAPDRPQPGSIHQRGSNPLERQTFPDAGVDKNAINAV